MIVSAVTEERCRDWDVFATETFEFLDVLVSGRLTSICEPLTIFLGLETFSSMPHSSPSLTLRRCFSFHVMGRDVHYVPDTAANACSVAVWRDDADKILLETVPPDFTASTEPFFS